jgi:hypothetical protein
MITITTRSSISVKADFFIKKTYFFKTSPLYHIFMHE